MKVLTPHYKIILLSGLIIAFFSGTLAGMYLGYLRSPYSWVKSDRKSVKIDFEFKPGTATSDNRWGVISKVESYYLYNGKRVLHGQKIIFHRDDGSVDIDSYIDGEYVGSTFLGRQPMPSDPKEKQSHY